MEALTEYRHSRAQGAAWVEARCRSGCPLGYRDTGFQHCSCILRRLQE